MRKVKVVMHEGENPMLTMCAPVAVTTTLNYLCLVGCYLYQGTVFGVRVPRTCSFNVPDVQSGTSQWCAAYMGCAGQKHHSLSPDTASSSFFAFALSHFPTSHCQPINQGPWQTRKRTLALDGAFLYPRKSL